MESGHKGKRSAVLAAVRRYPRFELAIHRLADSNEVFRDICEELAEAELALVKADTLPAALREARRAEWQELVDRLAGELRAAVESHEAFLRSRVLLARPSR